MDMLKKQYKILLVLVLLVLTVGTSLSSLELKEGRIKIVLHENIGKISAYYLSDISNNKYVSLFLDQDPRTTSLSVIEGNKVYRMGESSDFKQTIESTRDGAKFIWRSSTLEVTEDISFINSASSPVADGILLTISIKNISETTSSLGARYIFDTYLGEDTGTHFTTDTVQKISGETEYNKFNLPSYINSPGDQKNFNGFQLMLQGNGITKPDKVVLANWKRINDATWDYEVRSNRNFNQLPYSINDSGIALFYNQQNLSPGSSKTITLAFGAYNNQGFTAAKSSTKNEIAEVFNQTMNTASSVNQNTDLSVQTDLLTINELLKKINEEIEAGEAVTDSELEVMSQVLLELKKRKERYSSE